MVNNEKITLGSDNQLKYTNDTQFTDPNDLINKAYADNNQNIMWNHVTDEIKKVSFESIKNFVSKKDLSEFPNKEIGEVPWEENNPVLQVMNQFWLMNAYVNEKEENNWPIDLFYEMKTDQYPLTKESTTCTFYGTNNLYTGKITVTFHFDDTLKSVIGYGGRNGYIQQELDKKQDNIGITRIDNNLNFNIAKSNLVSTNGGHFHTNAGSIFTDGGNINVEGGFLMELPDNPLLGSNATNKNYVDNQIQKYSFEDKKYTDDSLLPLQTSVLILQDQLLEKQDKLISGENIKTIEGQSILGLGNIDLTKTDIGLENVNNTSDVNKPISTATQTALNLKADKSSVKFWSPITITGSGTRTVIVTGNLQVNSIYRIGYTWGSNTSQNISYVTYQHKNNITTPIINYWHSGVAGLLPNVLRLQNITNTGFAIDVQVGTIANDGRIFSVDIETIIT